MLLAGPTLLGATAISYARVPGANERIRLGHIGVGNRGRELASVVAGLKSSHNVEMASVCDLWKVNRERAARTAADEYGRPPSSFQYVEDLLAVKDLDAVIISTADFQHAPLLRLAAEAGKDAYCEKPMATDLHEAKAARDAVLSRKLVVQIGTQHRSEPYQAAVQDLVATGALGHISKVEIVWNYHGPRWRGRPEVQQIREEDTDWRKWLLTKPYRPFDPRAYFEFRLYSDFSSGIADQWMSHAIDMVHHVTGDPFPTFGRGPRRRFRLAGWARESGHVPGASGLPEGVSRQLFDKLWQRFGQLHAHHGRQRDAGEYRRGRKPALETG